MSGGKFKLYTLHLTLNIIKPTANVGDKTLSPLSQKLSFGILDKDMTKTKFKDPKMTSLYFKGVK